MSKNTKKKFGNETLFSQPIFMVLGRELLPKFSIVTKIFSIFFDGIPAFAPMGARDGHGTRATLFSLVRIAQRAMRPRRSHMRFELNIANECYFG